MSATDLQEREALEKAREDLGMPSDGPDRPAPSLGRGLAERAGDAVEPAEPAEPEEPEELFVLEQGRRVTISSLVARGTSVEYKVNMNAKSIPGGSDMGLLPYSNPDILLIVPARQGDVRHSPTYDQDGMVKKVTVYVNFKPLTFHDATSPEGRALLGLEEA